MLGARFNAVLTGYYVSDNKIQCPSISIAEVLAISVEKITSHSISYFSFLVALISL